MSRLQLVAVVGLLMLACVSAWTHQEEGAVANWTCPTNPAYSDGSCDPCGKKQWWGNWPYMACRGFSIRAFDKLGGNGYVTDIHFTDAHVEGPDLPVQMLCDLGFTHLKELDLNGNRYVHPPVTGHIPPAYGWCFKNLSTSKLSFNSLTGPLPGFIANNRMQSSFKARFNHLTGTIPAEIGAMPILKWLDLSMNNLTGTIPHTFRKSATMSLMQFSNNQLSGNLYNVPRHLFYVETANNPDLCGMVPASVRWARGYNPSNTRLGQPCPEENYPIYFDPGF